MRAHRAFLHVSETHRIRTFGRGGSEASEERKLAAACVAVAIAPCHKLDVMPSADQRFKMKWWGWGSDEIRKELPHSAATLRLSPRKVGHRPVRPRSEFKLQSLQLPESRATSPSSRGWARSWARNTAAPIIASGLCTRSGRVTKICCGFRQLVLEALPTPSSIPAAKPRSRPCSPAAGSCRPPSCPSVGERVWSAGSSRKRAAQRVVVTIDLALLNRVLAIDEVSQTATVEAGIFGPELESRLGERGFTLGHYPQSFEFSTLGGWIATRSSGQNSLAYGGIEKLVESVRVVTPQGIVETLHVPRRADGPDVGQMLIGSEGVYGVIVSATVRIRRAPAERDYFMYAFKDFAEGVAIARQLVQSGATPALLRVSDEEETAASLALGSRGGGTGWRNAGRRMVRKAVEWRLERLGIRPPAMSTLLVGLEGTHDENRRQRRLVHAALRRRVVRQSRADAGSAWLETRFDLPYLRDELMDNHLLVDTLETATTWNRLFELYAAVREAIHRAAEQEGEPIVVFTHVSHLYRDGASLYFSLLGRQKRADPIGQWWTIKRAAGDAIRARGPSSAIIMESGRTTARKRAAPVEQQMLAQLKATLDPAGIMNPGKLL